MLGQVVVRAVEVLLDVEVGVMGVELVEVGLR